MPPPLPPDFFPVRSGAVPSGNVGLPHLEQVLLRNHTGFPAAHGLQSLDCKQNFPSSARSPPQPVCAPAARRHQPLAPATRFVQRVQHDLLKGREYNRNKAMKGFDEVNPHRPRGRGVLLRPTMVGILRCAIEIKFADATTGPRTLGAPGGGR